MTDPWLAAKDALEASVSYTRKHVARLVERIKALEERAAVPGPQGPAGRDGVDGKDGVPGCDGQDGRDGIDGKDGTPGANGKDGIDGLNGKDGRDGKDGAPGKDGKSLTIEDIRPIFDVEVSKALLDIERRSQEKIDKAISSIQVKDGIDGKDGRDGVDGVHGKDGRDGLPGVDGASGRDGRDGVDGIDGKSVSIEDVELILESSINKALLDLEKRAQERLEKAIDRIPKPKDGIDGKDGFNLEDFQIEFDGERTVTFLFRAGELTRKANFALPILIDQGVHKEDREYHRGDGVTWGGSYWIAQVNKPQGRPGEFNKNWRLAVKKGRDGKVE